MIFSFIPLGKEVIKLKYDALRGRIKYLSIQSAVFGLSAIPGTSLLFDISLIIKEIAFIVEQLYLSEENIKSLSMKFGVDYNQLHTNVIENKTFFNLTSIFFKDQTMIDFFQNPITAIKSSVELAKFTQILVPFLTSFFLANSCEELLKFVPVVGSLAGCAISGVTTYFALYKVLNHFEETHSEILKYLDENRKI